MSASLLKRLINCNSLLNHDCYYVNVFFSRKPPSKKKNRISCFCETEREQFPRYYSQLFFVPESAALQIATVFLVFSVTFSRESLLNCRV
jgi:hypothetical protein